MTVDPALATHAPPAPDRPLRAAAPVSADDVAMDVALTTPAATFRDRDNFAARVAGLRSRGRLDLSERTLMVIGGVIAPLGLLFVLLAWVGAANTPYLFEQLPYLISGGLFGLALVFLGSFMYFAHWITELVKQTRAQSDAMVEALGEVKAELSRMAAATPATPVAVPSLNGSADRGDDVPLVATTRGSMAHRADCVVVAGKADLRAVTTRDGLNACKLCDPY